MMGDRGQLKGLRSGACSYGMKLASEPMKDIWWVSSRAFAQEFAADQDEPAEVWEKCGSGKPRRVATVPARGVTGLRGVRRKRARCKYGKVKSGPRKGLCRTVPLRRRRKR